MISPEFWHGKRVLLTGHTGFKGSWMALWLESLGAHVYGFGLEPDTDPSLFNLLSPWSILKSTIDDVRDAAAIKRCVVEADPEIVIHMAAQALVLRSYRDPVDTVASNVMGTVNVLEALRGAKNLKVALVITSDKVYQNTDDGEAFSEDASLGGDDPYSASKAAQEIVTHSWGESFFAERGVVIATARAGNVVGGGDFSEDRLIPDIYRALASGHNLTLRSPNATRPWQHVLDLNAGYLMYVERLATRPKDTPLALNFGPKPGPSSTVGAITNMMMTAMGQDVPLDIMTSKLKEKTLLSVNAMQAHKTLGWTAKLDVEATVRLTANWYGAFLNGASAKDITARQLAEFGKHK